MDFALLSPSHLPTHKDLAPAAEVRTTEMEGMRRHEEGGEPAPGLAHGIR